MDPRGETLTVATRHFYPPSRSSAPGAYGLQDFSRVEPLLPYSPCAKVPQPLFVSVAGEYGVDSVRTAVDPTLARGILSQRGRPQAATVTPPRVGGGGTLRLRARWGDGGAGQVIDFDVATGRAMAIPTSNGLNLDLLMSSLSSEAASVDQNQTLEAGSGGTQDNVVVTKVSVGAGWKQPSTFPETMTLTDLCTVGPEPSPSEGGPSLQFVPMPAFARRVRWDFRQVLNSDPLPLPTAHWVLWCETNAEASAELMGPFDVAQNEIVPGAAQGVMFVGDPDYEARIRCVWELQI